MGLLQTTDGRIVIVAGRPVRLPRSTLDITIAGQTVGACAGNVSEDMKATGDPSGTYSVPLFTCTNKGSVRWKGSFAGTGLTVSGYTSTNGTCTGLIGSTTQLDFDIILASAGTLDIRVTAPVPALGGGNVTGVVFYQRLTSLCSLSLPLVVSNPVATIGDTTTIGIAVTSGGTLALCL